MTSTASIAVAATVGIAVGTDSPAFGDHCKQTTSGGVTGGLVNVSIDQNCRHDPDPNDPTGAKRKSTYCLDASAEPAPGAEPGTTLPPVSFAPNSEPLGLFRYPDGREDSRKRNKAPRLDMHTPPAERGLSLWTSTIITDGGVPTHQKMKIWCEPSQPGLARAKVDELWVPLMTPDAAAQSLDLLARVQARMQPPTVNFLDADAEHGWLWVQVEHHLGVPRLNPIYEEAVARDQTQWAVPPSIMVWLSATPVALTIQIESDAGESYHGSCNLDTASSKTGCRVLFTHASSIADDGRFYGIATLEWTLSSNAGVLDGLRLYTNAEFSFEVAEAMAVSRE